MKKLRRRFYTAEERFAASFGRFILNFINLEAFYSTTSKSLDRSKSSVEEEWRTGVQKAAQDPKFQMRKGNPLFEIPKLGEGFANAMASRSLRLAKQTVDSAALVFAHTLLDEALS